MEIEGRFIANQKRDVICQPKAEEALDCTDLCKFNEAMLAKQVWRLIQDTDPLFYKVFTSKYYPNCSIFEAASSSGSFAWKNILRYRYLIPRGPRWRVRHGKTLRIFQDAWLLNSVDGWITSFPVNLAPKAIVGTIIDPHTG